VTIGIPTTPPPSRPPARGRRRWLAVVLLALVALGAATASWQIRAREEEAGPVEGPGAAAVEDTTARAPQGTRVRVLVVNTSGVTGLARRATQHLRDYGFDVVDFTSGKTDRNGETRIMAHTGHAEWAARVQKALGVGRTGTDADSSRYVDLTVFIGRDWRPPTETFRP
jgi:hypothetical protein